MRGCKGAFLRFCVIKFPEDALIARPVGKLAAAREKRVTRFLLVVTAVTVIIVAANKDMFFETRHVGRLLESVSAEQKA